MPVADVLSEVRSDTYAFSLEPTANALNSFMLLTMTESRSGLGEWVTNTRAAMSEESYQRHRLVMIGFYFLLTPDRQWSNFNAYLDHMARRDPLEMQNTLLEIYAGIGKEKGNASSYDKAQVLASADNYVTFLRERFEGKDLDEALEREAYEYMMQPEKMRALIVTQLREMWTEHFRAEWERVRPMLKDSVDAFKQVNIEQMDKLTAINYVSGESSEADYWKHWLEGVERVIFVPSAHVGPYAGRLMNDSILWVFFGARIPEGVEMDAPDLSRAELVVRLSALADNDRLGILKLISERGELKSQEVQEQLGFSQSASSRHLKQLSATGFLSERRCNGAKCYRLYPPKIDETLNALANYLAPTGLG